MLVFPDTVKSVMSQVVTTFTMRMKTRQSRHPFQTIETTFLKYGGHILLFKINRNRNAFSAKDTAWIDLRQILSVPFISFQELLTTSHRKDYSSLLCMAELKVAAKRWVLLKIQDEFNTFIVQKIRTMLTSLAAYHIQQILCSVASAGPPPKLDEDKN